MIPDMLSPQKRNTDIFPLFYFFITAIETAVEGLRPGSWTIELRSNRIKLVPIEVELIPERIKLSPALVCTVPAFDGETRLENRQAR